MAGQDPELDRRHGEVHRVGAGIDVKRGIDRVAAAPHKDRELPELLLVLTGKMSLVGPRPLPTRYLPRYTPEQMRRHEVRPGITGWAQVHGRNALEWESRFAHDVWYVDHRSLWLDAKILFLTVATVFTARGITEEGEATMSTFTGQPEE